MTLYITIRVLPKNKATACRYLLHVYISDKLVLKAMGLGG